MDASLESLKKENAHLKEEVRRLEAQRNLAYRDYLTGLHNQRYFQERLHQEVARARRWQWPCSVMVLDIDDFQRINAEHGQSVADEVLVWLGRFLQGNLREIDLACRIGDDEFAVILPYTDAEGTASVLARLRIHLARIDVSGALPVRVSIGAASYPKDGEEIDDLLGAADDAMFLEKRRRKATLSADPANHRD